MLPPYFRPCSLPFPPPPVSLSSFPLLSLLHVLSSPFLSYTQVPPPLALFVSLTLPSSLSLLVYSTIFSSSFSPGSGDGPVLCLLSPGAESTRVRWILQPQVSSQNNGRTRQEVCGWLRHLLPQVKVSNPHCNSTTR